MGKEAKQHSFANNVVCWKSLREKRKNSEAKPEPDKVRKNAEKIAGKGTLNTESGHESSGALTAAKTEDTNRYGIQWRELPRDSRRKGRMVAFDGMMQKTRKNGAVILYWKRFFFAKKMKDRSREARNAKNVVQKG